ncbi:MAG: response regulator [Syntrophobacteraceae bacterium]|jgi:CheY-like chemotaxis protein|nr:response regulator [Syntrophobacteraceae bacterium]
MKTILLIDDEKLLLNMLRSMLEREGFGVLEAEDGNRGLQLVREGGVDLVITDIFMPDKEGLETIRELRKVYPHIKIIAISGGSPKAEGFSPLPLAEKLGADHVLPKPFERSELLALIARCLE